MNNINIKKMGIAMVFCISLLLGFPSIQKAMAGINFETKLIFYPIEKHISPIRIKSEQKLENLYFYSLDGIKLNAWYLKAKKDKPTIIYCHGQGENISLWQPVAQFLTNNGYGVFMLEFRGHGHSEGIPSETGVYRDLESAIGHLKDKENIKQEDIVLWGRSLGGAVVADIASRDVYKGIILESTFTNIREEAMHLTETGILEGDGKFWSKLSTKFVRYYPMRQKFLTEKKIQKIHSPLLIAASINDVTVPPLMSYKLAKINKQAKLFISKTGSHHSSEWIKPRVLEFLNSL